MRLLFRVTDTLRSDDGAIAALEAINGCSANATAGNTAGDNHRVTACLLSPGKATLSALFHKFPCRREPGILPTWVARLEGTIMRVALAGFSMESASLVPVLATVEDFEAQAIRGESLVSQRRGTSTVIGGFIKVCQAEAVEIVPLVATSGGAAGSASDAAFDQYVAEICDGLRALQGRIDGVLLDIHGAMVTETRLDPDADIMRAVRDTVGPELPVIGGLDYHGNLDHDILTSATALFGYHKSPHTDMAETGERAARCMVATLRGHIKPLYRCQSQTDPG